jgi:hypothetical protein
LVVGDVFDTEETVLTTTLLNAGFDAIAVESGNATMKLLASGVEPCVVVIDVIEGHCPRRAASAIA